MLIIVVPGRNNFRFTAKNITAAEMPEYTERELHRRKLKCPVRIIRTDKISRISRTDRTRTVRTDRISRVRTTDKP